MNVRAVAAIATAGVAGATLRWSIATLLDEHWALFVVNVTGCAVIGFATAAAEQSRRQRRSGSQRAWYRHRIGRSQARRHRLSATGAAKASNEASPWLAAGFCGALTSMSALGLQLATLLDVGRAPAAAAWLFGTAAACAVAFVASRTLAAAAGARP